MAYNLPMEDAPSIALGKAFTQGTGLYNMLMEHAVKRAQSKRMDDQNRRAEEMQPFNIKKIQSAIANANAANSRAQALLNPRLQAYKDAHDKYTRESDPNYEINQMNKWVDWYMQQGASPTEAHNAAKNAIKNNIDVDILPTSSGQMESYLPSINEAMGKESQLPSINQAMGKESFIAGAPGAGVPKINPNAVSEYTADQFNKGQIQPEIEEPVDNKKQQYDALLKKVKAAILKKKTGVDLTSETPEEKSERTLKDYEEKEKLKAKYSNKENPEEKRKSDLKNKIELEKYKSKIKKAQEEDKNALKQEETKAKTIESAKNDLPHLQTTLKSLETMEKIAKNNPDLFGHYVIGGDRFAKLTSNPNAGAWQTLGLDPIIEAEMKMSSRGNIVALKAAQAMKPNFEENQKVALSKIKASIDRIKESIAHTQKIAGQSDETNAEQEETQVLNGKTYKKVNGEWHELQ